MHAFSSLPRDHTAICSFVVQDGDLIGELSQPECSGSFVPIFTFLSIG
jgi:hypothetical protein